MLYVSKERLTGQYMDKLTEILLASRWLGYSCHCAYSGPIPSDLYEMVTGFGGYSCSVGGLALQVLGTATYRGCCKRLAG